MADLELRTWSVDDQGGLTPTQYIVGATLGHFGYDEDSMMQATVVTLAQVFVQAGLDSETAFEKAYDSVVPEDGERTLRVKVVRSEDTYTVSFAFGDEDPDDDLDEDDDLWDEAS